MTLGNAPPIEYIRPYLIHLATGDVITAQHCGWMETVGAMMWAELVLIPQLKGVKGMLVWDNCASHRVKIVVDFLEAHNIFVRFLPPNMTDQLQVFPTGFLLILCSTQQRNYFWKRSWTW